MTDMRDDEEYIEQLEREIDAEHAKARERIAFLADCVEEAGSNAQAYLDLLVEVVGCPPQSLHPPCDNGYGCPFMCGDDEPDMRLCWEEIALDRTAQRDEEVEP